MKTDIGGDRWSLATIQGVDPAKAVTATRDSLSKALARHAGIRRRAAPGPLIYSPRYAARTFGSSSICFASPSIVTVPESIT